MLQIENTKSTPKVEIHHSSGTIRIIGRSYPEYPQKFYEDLYDELKKITSDSVDMYFDFDYLNTSSTKCILLFLKEVKKIWVDIRITWVHEEDDYDIIEVGEDFSELLDIEFNYIQKVEG